MGLESSFPLLSSADSPQRVAARPADVHAAGRPDRVDAALGAATHVLTDADVGEIERCA